MIAALASNIIFFIIILHRWFSPFAGRAGSLKIARNEARSRDAYFPLSVSLKPPMTF